MTCERERGMREIVQTAKAMEGTRTFWQVEKRSIDRIGNDVNFGVSAINARGQDRSGFIAMGR